MKRAISSVITSMLLVFGVIVLGGIIFYWVANITGQVIVIVDGKNAELACNDVEFKTSYSNGFLYIQNLGNVQIYDVKIIIYQNKDYETKKGSESIVNWSSSGINAGGAFSGQVNFDSEVDKIKIVPVLVGDAGEEKETYSCNDKYGKNIFLN